MKENFVNKTISIRSFMSCFDADYKAPYNFAGEFHPFWEMVYVKEGVVNVSGDEKVFKLHAGDVMFHKPMEFHRIWSDGESDIHAFIVSFYADGEFLSGALTLGKEQSDRINGIIAYAREQFYDSKGAYHNNMAKKVPLQIFSNMFENFLLSLGDDGAATVKHTENEEISQLFKKIILILNDNVYSTVTLEEIAESLGFCVSQIKRVFAIYSDIGIHKYLLKLKVAAAIRLMGDGLSVSETAEKLAFSSQNYFSTVFKREMGHTPSEYKRLILNN